MATSSKWACLPLLLLLALFVSFASAARIFPLDTDDHSSIPTISSPSDDLAWLPVTAVKRKLSVADPSHYDTHDDHSSLSTRMDDKIISFPASAPDWLFEKGEGVMSDDKDDTSSEEEFDELMNDLEDVGMHSSDGGFHDDKCATQSMWFESG